MFFFKRYIRVSTMDKEPIIPEKRFNRDYTFGWHFFKSLYYLAPYFYPGLEWSILFTLITMAFNGLSEYFTNHIGNIPGDMYLALYEKNIHNFWHIFVKGTYMYLAKCGTLALVTFFSWFLYISYRKNLVNALQKSYFKNRVYYKMNCVDNEGIDNPDQRLTQDIEKVCNFLATRIVPTATAGPFVAAYYTWRTWRTAGFLGIGIIYGYFVVGSLVNRFLIIPLTKWGARVEKMEGYFRYKHVTIRDNAESSALYNAEKFEEDECGRIFNILLKKQFYNVLWLLPVNYWKQFFDYYGGLLSYAIQYIPIIMLGTYNDKTAGELTQIISNNAFVYIYLINSFTNLTDLAIDVGNMSGIFQRVADFARFSEELEKDSKGIVSESYDGGSEGSLPTAVAVTRTSNPDVLFDIKNVSYGYPNSNMMMLNNLNLRLLKGRNLLISGPSGAGKTSLLRVLMKLWDYKSGSVSSGVASEDILHLPQKPYFPTGGLTLRQQIAFPIHLPETEQSYRDTGTLENIMVKLKIHHIIDRCHGFDVPLDFEWKEAFTPGELQRLSFVRLMYHRPALVMLDEATNAVTIEAERVMYQMLIDNDISFITAGHRPSLENYHDTELKLDGKTGYKVVNLPVENSHESL